jgi:hypothetical protein
MSTASGKLYSGTKGTGLVVNHMKILIHRKDAKNAKNLIAKYLRTLRSLRLCVENGVIAETQNINSAATMSSFTTTVNRNDAVWFTTNALARQLAVPAPLPALRCGVLC